MEQEATLSDVMGAQPVPFDVEGESFLIRHPSTEEYDDAISLLRLVQRRSMALPQVAELRDTPCSDFERASYEALIAASEREFEEAEEGTPKKRAMADEVARLQNDLDKRTLADEISAERGVLARDRWLCARLLCDADGKPVFECNAKSFPEKWERLPMSVKDAARPAIWSVLGAVRRAPFSWAGFRGRKSA
jgi:hypothetical protein